MEGAQRMRELILGLLEYSRLETQGKRPQTVSFDDVVQRAIANLATSIAEAGAEVHCRKLPEVRGDLIQLVRLMQNLIANAIKYRGREPPQIKITAKSRRNEWLFAVADNGIGIDPKYAERVFVIFQRLHTRHKFPGTGIGLALCKKIIQRHGGRIWVESQPGEGCTFYFTLPKPQGDKR